MVIYTNETTTVKLRDIQRIYIRNSDQILFSNTATGEFKNTPMNVELELFRLFILYGNTATVISTDMVG